MSPHRHGVGVVVIAASLAFVACSGDDVTPTTDTPTSTTLPTTTTTTTTAPETTTTSASTTTSAPTTTLAPDTVGDPAALEASIRQIAEELTLFYPDLDPDEVPIPDLTNPDPTVAVEESSRWSQWIAARFPSADWAVVDTVEGGPERDITVQTSEELFSRGWLRLRPAGSEWTYGDATVVDLTDLTLPPETLEGLPGDAVAVSYHSTSGPLHLVRADSGEIVEVLIDGWDWRSIAIVVPTSEGWKNWDTVVNYGGNA